MKTWITHDVLPYILWRPITKNLGDIVKIITGKTGGEYDIEELCVSENDDGGLDYPIVEIDIRRLEYENGKLTAIGERMLKDVKHRVDKVIYAYKNNPLSYRINLLRWDSEYSRAVSWTWKCDDAVKIEEEKESSDDDDDDEYGLKEDWEVLLGKIKEAVEFDNPEIPGTPELRVSNMMEILGNLLDREIASVNEGLGEYRWGRYIRPFREH